MWLVAQLLSEVVTGVVRSIMKENIEVVVRITV